MIKLRLITLATLLIAFSLPRFAFADGGKIGARAGYQLSNIYKNTTSLSKQPLNSFYVGIFSEHKIVPLLSIGSGLEYSQVGSVDDNDLSVKMHYIGIPTYLRVKLGPLYAVAGGTISFKIAEQWKLVGKDIDTTDPASWFDIPVYGGIGVQILMFRVEARYHWGTFDLYDKKLEGYKSQYLQIGVAVAI